MGINLKHSFRCQGLILKASFKLHEKASQWSTSHTNTMRLVGPLLIMGQSLILVIAVVASVTEPIIKGMVNIFGSPFFKNACSFSRGCKMLTIELLDKRYVLYSAVLWFVLLPTSLLATANTPVEYFSASSQEIKKHHEALKTKLQNYQ
jgi:hypothetical protein